MERNSLVYFFSDTDLSVNIIFYSFYTAVGARAKCTKITLNKALIVD